MVRELDLKKPPSIAESIDWARALLLLGADDIDADVFRATMSIIVKHRTDLDVVAERVGVRLGVAASADRAERSPAGRRRVRATSCAREGVAVGTSELLDAFAALGEVELDRARRRSARRWRRRSPSRRRTGACSSSSSTASSSAPPRRAAMRARRARGARRGRPRTRTASPAASRSTSTTCASRSLAGDPRRRRAAHARPRAARDRRLRPPRRGLGRDRRRRAAHPPRARPALRARRPAARADGRAADGAARATRSARFEQLLRRELERAQIERTQSLPPARPLNELDRALPVRPAAGPRRRAPRRRAAQAPARHAGPRARAAAAPRARRRAPHDARLAADRRRAGRAQVPPAAAAAPGALRAVRRLDLRHQRVACSSCRVLHALHDSFRKMRSFVFVERISEVTDVFERERSFRPSRDAISKDAGVADVSGYTDYGRVWREFLAAGRGRPAPARDGDRARRRAHQRPRPARRRLRRDRRARRPHVLAQPRAAAVLELRRLGDRRLRAALRGLRVLDDAPARGLRARR